jgi:hypothetical protein
VMITSAIGSKSGTTNYFRQSFAPESQKLLR